MDSEAICHEIFFLLRMVVIGVVVLDCMTLKACIIGHLNTTYSKCQAYYIALYLSNVTDCMKLIIVIILNGS